MYDIQFVFSKDFFVKFEYYLPGNIVYDAMFFILGQIDITSDGSLAVGSNLSLYCDTPSFNSSSTSGSWYRNEKLSTLCNNAGFCTIKTDGNYSFTANSTGMSVHISPLEITENGVIWKCVISREEAYFEIILRKFYIVIL